MAAGCGMTTERIDVLAVLDCRVREVEQDGISRATELREARAAVAELIEAGKELVDAQADYDAIDFPGGRRLDRLSAARERHAAALARVGAP